MLQKLDVETFIPEQDGSHLLRPAFYWEVIKRRFLYFLVPFVLVLAAGITATWLWPTTYLSEGRILVQTQQIPTDLVRPTVTSLAYERIQVIQQRVLTRDNLVAIVAKFGLFPNSRTYLSVTEQTELMRKSIEIQPLTLSQLRPGTRPDTTTIAFTVGFYYEDPLIATRVANELMTRILNEDLRDRTTRASDTTKFLTREVQRLRDENNALDTKIAEFKNAHPASVVTADKPVSAWAQLKAEYEQKSQVYSDKHPALMALKRQLEAMEKGSPTENAGGQGAAVAGLETLQAQQEALQKDLEVTTQKLAAARLGETLERDQQSEKFEVIEQPTEPVQPFKPNRPKMIALTIALALMAGVGLAFVGEMADKSIRKSADLLSIADGALLVSIPYIPTIAEIRRRRRNLIIVWVTLLLLLVGAGVAAYFFMPPLELLLTKIKVSLSQGSANVQR